MKRKIALEYIRIEFAKNGECTDSAMRYFIENRISRKAFDEAAQKGLKIYNLKAVKKNEDTLL